MNIEKYLTTEKSKKLHNLLKNMYDDDNFLLGIASMLETDAQRDILIEEIEEYDLKDRGLIILMAADIADGYIT